MPSAQQFIGAYLLLAERTAARAADTAQCF